MLHRTLLIAMTPAALAGGTLASWLGLHHAGLASVPGTLPRSAPVDPAAGLRIVTGADQLLHARIAINGVPIDMIVDTGASRTLLSQRDARRAFGGAPEPLAGTIRTLGGEQPFAEYQASAVQLGATTFRNLKVGTIAGGEVSVLGLDWLDLAGPVRLRP